MQPANKFELEYNSLGELICVLSLVSQDKPVKLVFEEDDDAFLYDPIDFMSWRGSYDCLGLSYGQNQINVKEFLSLCRQQIGAIYTGYKGGEYTMDTNTSVFISQYKETGDSRAIIFAEEVDDMVLLHTQTDTY